MFDYRRVSQNRGKIWAPSPLVHTSCAHKIGLVNALARALKGKQMRFSPHLCVGFLFLGLYPAVRLLPPPPVVSCPHHTQLILTHNLLTHILSSHNLLTHTQLVITQLAHSHTSCSHTTYHLLTHILSSHLHFAWQAWHLVTSTFTLRGRRGTW